MELRLFFEDYFNAEPEGDDEYSIPTIEQTIPNPDDEALRDALFQVAEKSALDPTVILVHSNSRDFVQFFPLVNPLDKEEEAEPLMDAELEGGGKSAEPSAPPAPGGDEDLAGEEDEALRQLPEDLCHVEYCKHLPGKHHAQFFTEKLTLPEVLEILQLFVAGDESWQKRKEWRLSCNAYLVRQDYVFTLCGDPGLQRVSPHWLWHGLTLEIRRRCPVGFLR